MRENLEQIHPGWLELITSSPKLILAGDEVKKRMEVVGEEGTSLADFILHLKAEFLDSVYLQQNAFDAVGRLQRHAAPELHPGPGPGRCWTRI